IWDQRGETGTDQQGRKCAAASDLVHERAVGRSSRSWSTALLCWLGRARQKEDAVVGRGHAETPARHLDRPAASRDVRQLGSVRGLACKGRILRFGRTCKSAAAEPGSPEG